MTRVSMILPLLVAPVLAHAQEADGYSYSQPRMSSQSSGTGAIFTLGAGVAVAPKYPGSDEFTTGPDMVIRFHALNYNGTMIGNTDPNARNMGFSVSGSFRYVGERDTSEYPELFGMDDVEDSIELGLGLNYEIDNLKLFSDVRYGVTGHNTWVGEVGADFVTQPMENLTLTMGPRAFWGTEKFAQTYYGVTAAESAASGGALAAFDADGGFLSAGVELGARYSFDSGWGLESTLRYDKLISDAGDSPITKVGSDEQWRFNLDVTRVFRMGAI
ncbi:hypothetical protein BFP70_12675 [Thioclava sp. SK-1]|uniref:MipA/OmpV family protein n=1 Tax=Thioclava sp. SK-1 TaxID=1889770 RepID=UPI0008249763|nr:MipA/OmpV family protein [Thioclava sp. SK-1]OCX63065.1 hypothetical protein BFP70_12675 [Thioclava sp. SK-1]